MDKLEIVSHVVKYLNFEQLCIAERINKLFQSCIQRELHYLKHIDFEPKFAVWDSCGEISRKIRRHCFNLRTFSNLRVFISRIDDRCERADFLCSEALRFLEVFEIHDIFDEEDSKCYLYRLQDAKNLSSFSFGAKSLIYPLTNVEPDMFFNVIKKHKRLISLNFAGPRWSRSLCEFQCLTRLKINVENGLDPDEFEQLLELLTLNPSLENLNLSRIWPCRKLFQKLLNLQKLQSLKIILESHSPFEYIDGSHPIGCQHFHHLYNLEIENDSSEHCRQFMCELIKRCSSLKRFILTSDVADQNFYSSLLDCIRRPELMECLRIKIYGLDESTFVTAFYDQIIQNMPNLHHVSFDVPLLVKQAEKIGRMKKLSYMEFTPTMIDVDATPASIVRKLCANSLIAIKIAPDFPLMSYRSTMNIIMNQCPNLQYLSSPMFTKEQMRNIPSKLPKLIVLGVVLEVVSIGDGNNSQYTGIEDLVYVIQNSSNLRHLIMAQKDVYSLLTSHVLQQYCRQGKLKISVRGLGEREYNFCPELCRKNS